MKPSWRALGEFERRQDLAARNAVHIGDKALDLIDLPFVEPFFQVFHDNRLMMGRRQPPSWGHALAARRLADPPNGWQFGAGKTR